MRGPRHPLVIHQLQNPAHHVLRALFRTTSLGRSSPLANHHTRPTSTPPTEKARGPLRQLLPRPPLSPRPHSMPSLSRTTMSPLASLSSWRPQGARALLLVSLATACAESGVSPGFHASKNDPSSYAGMNSTSHTDSTAGASATDSTAGASAVGGSMTSMEATGGSGIAGSSPSSQGGTGHAGTAGANTASAGAASSMGGTSAGTSLGASGDAGSPSSSGASGAAGMGSSGPSGASGSSGSSGTTGNMGASGASASAGSGGDMSVAGAGQAGSGGDMSMAGTGSVDPCHQVDGSPGCCMGDVAMWFSSGTVHSKDCTQSGEYCGWSSSKNYYTCVSSPGQTDPSGSYPPLCGSVPNPAGCP